MTDSALAIAAAVRGGSASAIDVLEATLERVARVDRALNCFTGVYVARARREARSIDEARAAGRTLPALAGVPYAVKNLFDVEGEVTLAGGAINRSNAPARRDATLIDRMRGAGAVLVGALNMDEHAYGFTTENSSFGATRNPHDPMRTAGGSSGGSGAAVAARMVPLSLGSDTNGSIRVPASLCGTFGLKPTYGRLPRSASFPFVHSLDHLGPFANSVADLGACYDALQGYDAGDPVCAERPAEPVSAQLDHRQPWRVGILDGYFADWAGPAARTAVQYVADALGARERVTWASAAEARAAAFVITGSEGGSLHLGRLTERYREFEPLSRDRLLAGAMLPARWYLAAQKWRAIARAELLALFERFDVLLAPATPVTAPLLGTEWLELNGQRVPARASLGLLTQPVSCVGLPVCCVPVWPHGDPVRALPIGVQIIAAPWREDHCLRVARVLEAGGIVTSRPPTGAADGD